MCSIMNHSDWLTLHWMHNFKSVIMHSIQALRQWTSHNMMNEAILSVLLVLFALGDGDKESFFERSSLPEVLFITL